MHRLKSVMILRFILILTSVSSAMAQTPTNDVHAALLQEVRLLRAAVERATSLSTRAQLLIQRVQSHEERFGRLAANLEATRKEITNAKAEQTHALDLMARTERERTSSEISPARRASLEGEILKYKQRALDLSQREEQARVQESQGLRELNLERAQQSELLGRLEEIEPGTPDTRCRRLQVATGLVSINSR